MKTKEFDRMFNDFLEEETKKLIKEQFNNTNKLSNSVKNFQTLSGLIDKISGVKTKNSGVIIRINNITPKELINCCGGGSIEKAQTNLMQGLHYDLKENDIHGNYDIDINTEGDENTLQLTINISIDESIEKDMEESIPKDTNPMVKDKKNVILGNKEVDEQWQAMAGRAIAGRALAGSEAPAIVNRIATTALGNEIADALGDNDEDSLNEYNTPKHIPSKKISKKMNQNNLTKKTIKLSESEMKKLLEKIIKEAVESPNIPVPANGVPGIDVTKKSHKDSGRENDMALKDIEKKIKEYLSFDGNDDPNFPNQVGVGDKKVATKNSDEENDVVDLNRGRNSSDLTYDQEPSKEFKERAKLSLIGHTKMGNSQDAANVIPSKTGNNIYKVSEKRKKANEDEPFYAKEPVPVKNEKTLKDKTVASDILRMKQIGNYNKKTQ